MFNHRMPASVSQPGTVNNIWVLDTESFAGHGVDGVSYNVNDCRLSMATMLLRPIASMPAASVLVIVLMTVPSRGQSQLFVVGDHSHCCSDDFYFCSTIIFRRSRHRKLGVRLEKPRPGVGQHEFVDPNTPIIEAPAWLVKLAVGAATRGGANVGDHVAGNGAHCRRRCR